MGLLDKIRKRGATAPEPVNLSRGAGFDLGVVGEIHYQDVLRTASHNALRNDDTRSFVEVKLVREPKNAHDPNAVAVHLLSGPKVGYLPREEATDIASFLDALAKSGRYGWCTAAIYGGSEDHERFGVWLAMHRPSEFAYEIDDWLSEEETT